jgi:LPS O-antigen subunit length determinant protein (WzzB/FepE family)
MLSALDTAAPDTQAAVAAWFAQDMSKVNLALTSAFAAAKLLYEEGSEELKAELTGLREAYKKDKLVLEAERDLRLKAISEASAAATSTSKRVKKSATPPSSACEQSGSGSEVQVVDDEEGAGGK